VVTMMLPEGIELLKQKKLMEEERLAKINKVLHKHDKEEMSNVEASPMVSSKTSDVEYDVDYDNFNEIQSLNLKTEKPEQTTPKPRFEDEDFREYSIETWNGSPGLNVWGYNKSAK
jgi:hypothetical protein